eukprot:gene10105-7072_t
MAYTPTERQRSGKDRYWILDTSNRAFQPLNTHLKTNTTTNTERVAPTAILHSSGKLSCCLHLFRFFCSAFLSVSFMHYSLTEAIEVGRISSLQWCALAWTTVTAMPITPSDCSTAGEMMRFLDRLGFHDLAAEFDRQWAAQIEKQGAEKTEQPVTGAERESSRDPSGDDPEESKRTPANPSSTHTANSAKSQKRSLTPLKILRKKHLVVTCLGHSEDLYGYNEAKLTPAFHRGAGILLDEYKGAMHETVEMVPHTPYSKKAPNSDLPVYNVPLQIVFQRGKTGLEPHDEFPIVEGELIAGRYRVTQFIDAAAFSRTVSCFDEVSHRPVCLKIVRNTKENFDQSLDEIKLLLMLNEKGDPNKHCILRMYDFFYFKEHLFLVTELLLENLYLFGKHSRDQESTPYFTLPRIQAIAKQVLIALQFLHIPALLASMSAVSGPMPSAMLHEGRNTPFFVTKHGAFYERVNGQILLHFPLERVNTTKAFGFDDTEYINFIEQCLVLDPNKRPSAETLLNHPFLQKNYGSCACEWKQFTPFLFTFAILDCSSNTRCMLLQQTMRQRRHLPVVDPSRHTTLNICLPFWRFGTPHLALPLISHPHFSSPFFFQPKILSLWNVPWTLHDPVGAVEVHLHRGGTSSGSFSMSGQGEDAPLPRYRFYHKPQQWHKESLRFVVPTDDEANNEGNQLPESSFDYFLRRSYAVQKIEDPQARLAQKRAETIQEIDRFQARNMIAGASSINVIDKESSDDDSDNMLESDLDEREGSNATPSTVVFANPLMGYVSGFPLYDIYKAMVEIKREVLENGTEDEVADLQLSYLEFEELIKQIGDGNLLSAGYVQKIFHSLPCYNPRYESMCAYPLFSYIVEHTYHPALNRNVNMLFHAFAKEGDDSIPLVSLHSRVVSAWAELNTFGNLRGQWVKLAKTLEIVERDLFKEKLVVRHCLFLNQADVRALMCTDPLLWKVMNSIDMDGGRKKKEKASITLPLHVHWVMLYLVSCTSRIICPITGAAPAVRILQKRAAVLLPTTMSRGKPTLSQAELQEIKQTTALTEAQILRLYNRFVKLDTGNRGTISKDELNEIPGLASNPLVQRVIAVMDSDQDGRVTFVELAQSLAILSPQMPKESKLRFTFKMYDVDGDGKVSNKDLFETLRVMVGENLTGVQIQQIVDKTFIEADLDRDGYITFEDFQRLSAGGDFGERLNLHF